jgi:hypothetical protein
MNALVFQAARDCVPISGRRGGVASASQVAADGIICDGNPARVVEGLQVTSYPIVIGLQVAIVFIESQVPVDIHALNIRCTGTFDLNVSSDVRARIYVHPGSAICPNVAIHIHVKGV